MALSPAVFEPPTAPRLHTDSLVQSSPTHANDNTMHQANNTVVVRHPSLDAQSSSSSSSSSGSYNGTTGGIITKTAAENPVVVVGRRGCCMVYVVRRLLQGLGVNPVVCEVGEDDEEEAAIVEEQLAEMAAGGWLRREQQMLFPAVFIGGRLVGGLDRLMSIHISGELVPVLKEAGALWL